NVSVLASSRLAILTNGGGIGVLAVDRLADLGGVSAGGLQATMKKLDALLPPIWSRANPVDIAGDADAGRYANALAHLLEDQANDAVLVMNVPTALASAGDAAHAVVAATARHRQQNLSPKPVFAVWVGRGEHASEMFGGAGIPDYATENEAVAGFMHLVQYRESRRQLMAAPPSLPEEFESDDLRRGPIAR